MVITYYNQAETKVVMVLLATSKIALLIINNQVFLKTSKILFQIYYYLNQNPSLGIIYRLRNQVDFIDHFNNARGKLPFQSNGIYLRGDCNINLFFKVIIS